MHTHCVVLDMDGVVLDSESIKLAAFHDLFADYPDHLEAIDQYNRQQRGVPRRQKFDYVLSQIIHLPPGPEILDKLSEQYSQHIRAQMLQAPLVSGVAEFLNQPEFSFYLNSSAPLDEIEQVLAIKGIRQFFKQAFGYPAAKREVLAQLGQDYSPGHVTFFGDALADFEAAQVAGVDFVGVCLDSDSCVFTSLGVPIIRDFSDLPSVIRLIKGAENGISRLV